jgi:hypothetical protein
MALAVERSAAPEAAAAAKLKHQRREIGEKSATAETRRPIYDPLAAALSATRSMRYSLLQSGVVKAFRPALESTDRQLWRRGQA